MEKRIKELEKEVIALNKSLSNLLGTLEKTGVYTSSEKESDYAAGALKWAEDVGVLKYIDSNLTHAYVINEMMVRTLERDLKRFGALKTEQVLQNYMKKRLNECVRN